nr:Unknown Function [uncultured bacterium]
MRSSGLGADAAEQAEDGLDEQRAAGQAAGVEVRQVVQVGDVIAFELEPGPVLLADAQNGLDVLEGVLEDKVAALFEAFALPFVAEVLEAVQHRVQAEVHRAHVQRRQLGLEQRGRPHPFLHAHVGGTAGGDVDDGVGVALELVQDRSEVLRILRGAAVLRVTGVHVHDRGSGLRGTDRSVGDFLRRDRQVRGHGRGVDSAGDGAGDDDFACCSHGLVLRVGGLAVEEEDAKGRDQQDS